MSPLSPACLVRLDRPGRPRNRDKAATAVSRSVRLLCFAAFLAGILLQTLSCAPNWPGIVPLVPGTSQVFHVANPDRSRRFRCWFADDYGCVGQGGTTRRAQQPRLEGRA